MLSSYTMLPPSSYADPSKLMLSRRPPTCWVSNTCMPTSLPHSCRTKYAADAPPIPPAIAITGLRCARDSNTPALNGRMPHPGTCQQCLHGNAIGADDACSPPMMATCGLWPPAAGCGAVIISVATHAARSTAAAAFAAMSRMNHGAQCSKGARLAGAAMPVTPAMTGKRSLFTCYACILGFSRVSCIAHNVALMQVAAQDACTGCTR